MISIELQVSGQTIGTELAKNAEETAYALTELAGDTGEDFGVEVADFLSSDCPSVVAFLRTLADQIEAAYAEQ